LGVSWILGVFWGAIGLGLLMWSINFLIRKDKVSVAYLAELRKRMRREREASLLAIEKELRALRCEAGSIQMQNLRAKYDSFVAVIEEKFNPIEVTYGRYLGIAEQLYLAGIDNLRKVTVALKSVNSIDRDYIQRQMSHLDNNGIVNDASDYRALEDRLSLLEETESHVDRLLVENERAMTQLVEAAARLAHVQTSPGEARLEMEEAMGELSHIAQNMEAYDQRRK